MRASHRLMYFLFFALLAGSSQVRSRNFPLQHFTTDNGLPSNTVYGLYRDSKGFLWMGTDKGVVRYNGLEFEKFTTDDGLADNEIFFFREDYEGRLWLSTYNGELCFYKDGVFHTSKNTPFLKAAVQYAFIDLMNVEKDSSITMSFKDRIAFLNIKGDKCSYYYINHAALPTEWIIAINKISENRYSVCAADKNYIIDTFCNYIPNSIHQNPEMLRCVIAQDMVSLCSSKGIYSQNMELKMKFSKALSESYIHTIYKSDTDWFIGTSSGLFVGNDLQILRGHNINSIVQDIEGNYWFSDLNNGVYCLGKNYSHIEEYDSIYYGNVRYAKSMGKYLFFTTDNSNFYRFGGGKTDLLFDYFQHFGRFFPNEKDRQHYISTHSYGQGIDNRGTFYNIDQPFSFEISKIDTKAPIFHIYKKVSWLLPDFIKEMFFVPDKIFVRNPDFISVIRTSGNNRRDTVTPIKIGSNMRGRRVFGMAVAPDQSIWYSSFDHVNRIADTTSVPQLQFGNVTFKWMELAGNYAVGITHKNQLLICRDFAGNTIHIDTLAGQNLVWDKLYKLSDSTFLVSTDNLYRLLSLHSPTGDQFSIRIIENNLLPLHAQYICNNDSFCYFFKNGSITCVPTGDLVESHLTPKIIFKSLKTRIKSYNIEPGMVIGYDESKNINISFSPFSFGSRYLVCQYSISRDSAEYWRQVTNNEINLFDPPFGNYIVKVRARTLSGDFSQPFVFSFTISKPFWATTWFRLAIMLLCTTLVVFASRLIVIRNTRRRERAHQNEIKFLKSEYTALNALMNPHFIFNTLNNVQWLVNNDDKLTANHYLRVFSDLVRQNMNNIAQELIPLSSEIELVSNYLKLEKLRFKDALNYEIDTDSNVDMDNVKVPPLLIQPLVENAIRHGILPGTAKNNILKIHIYVTADKLFVDIIDNGIGFNESQKKTRSLHKSTGILNIRKRIEKLSMMHKINISLEITELVNDASQPTGTLARICIE